MFTILLLGIIVMAASSSQSMDIHFLQLQRVRNPENAKHLFTLTHTEKTEFRQCACGIFAFCSRVAQVGSWQICLWTIKVLHRVGSRREPRCPVILDILQTAWTSCRAVCATDGWSLELTSLFFFLAGTVIVSHHYNHLRVRVCFMLCLCARDELFGVVWVEGAAGK